MSRIWPCTTRAIEAFGLVHRQQCPRTFELDALLAQCPRSRAQCAPTAGRRVIRCKNRRFRSKVIGHGRALSNENLMVGANNARSCPEADPISDQRPARRKAQKTGRHRDEADSPLLIRPEGRRAGSWETGR